MSNCSDTKSVFLYFTNSEDAAKCIQYFSDNKFYEIGSKFPIKAKFALEKSSNCLDSKTNTLSPNTDIKQNTQVAQQPKLLCYDNTYFVFDNINDVHMQFIYINTTTNIKYARIHWPIWILECNMFWSFGYYVSVVPETTLASLVPVNNGEYYIMDKTKKSPV